MRAAPGREKMPPLPATGDGKATQECNNTTHHQVAGEDVQRALSWLEEGGPGSN